MVQGLWRKLRGWLVRCLTSDPWLFVHAQVLPYITLICFPDYHRRLCLEEERGRCLEVSARKRVSDAVWGWVVLFNPWLCLGPRREWFAWSAAVLECLTEVSFSFGQIELSTRSFLRLLAGHGVTVGLVRRLGLCSRFYLVCQLDLELFHEFYFLLSLRLHLVKSPCGW